LGGGEVYFDDFVTVGSTFRTVAEERFTANMNVTIYRVPDGVTTSDDIILPENLLQTVKYHSSCSRNLFLKDRYGSIQLVSFENEDQGVVSCFVNTTIFFDIVLPIELVGSGLIMETVIVSTSPGGGVQDLSSQVAGRELTTAGLRVETSIELDLTVRQTYTVNAAIVGVADDGTRCVATGEFDFLAGNRPPAIFPTMSPTGSPTVSNAPTPDIGTTSCNLQAMVECCVVRDGLPCDVLAAPTLESCVVDGAPTADRLAFVYSRTGRCANDNNTNTDIDCTDLDMGGTIRPVVVFVEAGRKDELFFFGSATFGTIFEIPIPEGNNDFTITIFDRQGGNVLQILENFPTRCRPASDLTLLKTYGAFQLLGFEVGDISSFVKELIEFKYTTTNAISLASNLTLARRSVQNVFLDFVNGTTPVNVIDLAPQESVRFTERFTLNLLESRGTSIFVTYFTIGFAIASGLQCTDMDVTTITIN
jgi:hypothetical protein